MANNTQAFERTDRALADTFNTKMIDPVNLAITEFNDHEADAVKHITATERTNYITNFTTTVRAAILTGLSTATNAVISATDTILTALGKLQRQISDHLSDAVKHITAAERTAWDGKIDKSVLTAAGDIIYGSAAATPAKLAKGTDGQALTLSGGLPAWGDLKSSQTFTTNGTFVVPNGVTGVYISGVAAGNDGQDGKTNGSAGGTGGAGGQIKENYYAVVTPGASIPITVGTGNTVIGSILTLVKGAGYAGGTGSSGSGLGNAGTSGANSGLAGSGGLGNGLGFAGGGGGAGYGFSSNGGAGGNGMSVSGGPAGNASNATGYGAGGGGGGTSYGGSAGTKGLGSPGILIVRW